MFIAESPTIVQFDDGPHKWAAGQSYNLTCKVFGAPTPIISWKKNQQSLTGGRFITNDDGTLQILVTFRPHTTVTELFGLVWAGIKRF